MLQQSQKTQADEAIIKAREAGLEETARSCKVSLSHFDTLLAPIMETCTKDSISSGKSWMFQQVRANQSPVLYVLTDQSGRRQ